MLYQFKETSKVESLFSGWNDSVILSCLQGVMGKIYVTDLNSPESAFAHLGDFGYLAGKPEPELFGALPEGFVILVPLSDEWAGLIERHIPRAKKLTRYAIKKGADFDVEALRKNIEMLPEGYSIADIDGELYDKCLESPAFCDFVSSFDSKEHFLTMGLGKVVLKNGEIVAGASSYSRYKEGIEIEVVTKDTERQRGLATVACSALILKCLSLSLYPSWDARTKTSVRLAEKLGYRFDREYTVYEVGEEN